jgi:sec-independent protein translocase protein TatB
MLDVAPTELLLVAVVALVVIGPKDLPKAMRVVGQWVGRARGMARHFRSGIDEMIRQSELEEMEKKWRDENERIMREFPTLDDPALLTGSKSEETAALPALTGPAGPDPDAAPIAFPDDAEHAASYVAPEAVSPQDLANWHDGAPSDAPSEAPPEDPSGSPPESPVDPEPSEAAAAAPEPSVPADRGEEQLSLLPPDPPAAPPAKAPK